MNQGLGVSKIGDIMAGKSFSGPHLAPRVSCIPFLFFTGVAAQEGGIGVKRDEGCKRCTKMRK